MGGTRKTIVAISAGLVSVLIMAGVAAASRGSNDANPVRPVGVEDNSTSTSSTSTPSSGVTTTNAPGVTTVEPGDDNGVDTPTSFADNGNDTSTTIDDHGDDTSTTFDDPSTTVAPIVTGERTFTGAGGTVVVNVNADHSRPLVSVTPNAGVEVKDQRAEGDEVRVEFRGPDGDSRVRIRFDEGGLRIETGDN